MTSEQRLSTKDLEEIPNILLDLQLQDDYDRVIVSPGYRALHQIVSMRQDTPGTQRSEYKFVGDLLNHFRETGIQATNPRDYVYSILGIYPRAGQLFTPDYSLSVRDLFIDVARKLLDESGGLNLLTQCDNVGRDFKHIFPSWVPDWATKPRAKDLKPNVVLGVHRAIKSNYALDPFSPRLTVHGKPLGTVRWIHDYDLDKNFGHFTYDQFKQHDHSMLSALDRIASALSMHRPRTAPQMTKGAMLWELDLAVGSLHKRNDGSEDIHWQNDGRKPATSLLIICSKATGRRFCIGDGNIVGLVPQNSISGDEVWLLHGSCHQYVLRMVDEGEYLLVGTCIWDWRGLHTQHGVRGWAKYDENEVRKVVLV
ncbi:hypothetical protein CLAFUW4_08194 [Fulvia fulva]|uniref:Uncharacterized protein n=1 Tax=Passalora fulva TaxID=5499 RepID=A0A9Q8LDI9_PASFU|nr:uncharacterized protein CLAFUR5_08307 [Fulvia fulva]KAK4629674.1 hypothetical protein CLAFUR4_08199 [Fulvia fulva]KAK4630310.1 hypothetical protein CLAFUR0_08194 [Fulvia fulva]UJO15409.1 hypothetical protein CLAFUR5_08307 [Fulvia fulva]WPV12601.1 hypothetical protein CLAFUW4_08194 [Fulvia fulva]WPV27153.1 hypothetical protein CLAFUW7_08194 [Fulvia fulva]